MDLWWFQAAAGFLIGTLAIYLSKPERPAVGRAMVVVLAVAALWQASDEYRAARVDHQLQQSAHRELARALNSYTDTLARLLVASSDGWLPQAVGDFYTPRTLAHICNDLDIEAQASTIPPLPWWSWAGERIAEAEETIEKTLLLRGHLLDPGLLEALRSFLENGALTFHLTAHRSLHREYLPPTFCAGIADDLAPDLLRLRAATEALEPYAQGALRKPTQLLSRRDLTGEVGRARKPSHTGPSQP
jgi:hypothetical protein